MRMRAVRRSQARFSRGQTLALTAGVAVLGFAVILTLHRFMTRVDRGQRPRNPVYLSDEGSVVSRRSAGASSQTVAQQGTRGEQDGQSGGSAEKGQASVHARSRTVRLRKGRGFSFSAGSRVFEYASEEAPRAVHRELRDMLTSPNVQVRLFGTPEGDFIYHREYGWMQFRKGRWTILDPFALPVSLRQAYPELCDYEVARGGGCLDSDFSRKHWWSSQPGLDG